MELILNVGGGDNLNTRLGSDAANNLLAKEVSTQHIQSDQKPSSFNQYRHIYVFNIPNLNLEVASLAVLLNVHVDGKVSIDVAHLVQETAGNTDDQVVDEGTDSSESGNTLASTMVQLNGDGVLVRATEAHSDVGEVLREFAPGSLDGDNPGANVNGNCNESNQFSLN